MVTVGDDRHRRRRLSIWLVQIGEPLPTDPGHPRLMRTGLMAAALAESGHDVTWWTSGWDGRVHRRRHRRTTWTTVGPRYRLCELPAVGYTKNVSLRRLVDHITGALIWYVTARRAPPPDVILASFPSVETAFAATVLARTRSIPVFIDVRDLYPDTYLDAVPSRLRGVARPVLWPFEMLTRRTVARADGLVAISPSFLAWALARARRLSGPLDAMIPIGYPAPGSTEDDGTVAARRLSERGVALSGRRRLIWYVGAFNRIIDLATVIEAVRGLDVGQRAGVQVVFSGDGEFREEWEAAAADLDEIVFTGWIDEHEIAVLQRCAWLGLAPYRPNTPPALRNKYFEYMSRGIPVVSSLGGEVEELLDEAGCGVSYRAGSPESLRSAVAALLADPDRRESMSARARTLFLDRYTVSRSHEAIEALLQQAVTGSGVAGNDRAPRSSRGPNCGAVS